MSKTQSRLLKTLEMIIVGGAVLYACDLCISDFREKFAEIKYQQTPANYHSPKNYK